jgi:hypothetical protein
MSGRGRSLDMRVENAQRTLLLAKSPSASQLFVKGYQPLCGDSEGWGPISPIRYDFTPCFLDVWIISVAAWGLLGGAAALWFLLKKRAPQEVSKNWHFYTKLVSRIT